MFLPRMRHEFTRMRLFASERDSSHSHELTERSQGKDVAAGVVQGTGVQGVAQGVVGLRDVRWGQVGGQVGGGPLAGRCSQRVRRQSSTATSAAGQSTTTTTTTTIPSAQLRDFLGFRNRHASQSSLTSFLSQKDGQKDAQEREREPKGEAKREDDASKWKSVMTSGMSFSMKRIIESTRSTAELRPSEVEQQRVSEDI